MEATYLNRFTPALLAKALARYGLAPDEAEWLGGFENLIYKYSHEGQAYILRLAHSSRRSRDLIEAEVDWINYLAGHNVPVAAAVHSDQGHLVEAVDDGHGEAFLATAFDEAPGSLAREVARQDEAFYRSYGELLGRMHALTKDYQPPSPQIRRFAWDDPAMAWAHKTLPISEAIAKAQYSEIIGYLRGVPTGREEYGLVHYDAHGSNLLVTEDGRLTLIDFDDSAYGWFMQDIAIVLFYITYSEQERESFAQGFLPPFLEGYARHNRLDPKWLRLMPVFLKQREIEVYAVTHRDLDVDNLEHPRVRAFMEGRKERIERGLRYLEMDFKEYERYL